MLFLGFRHRSRVRHDRDGIVGTHGSWPSPLTSCTPRNTLGTRGFRPSAKRNGGRSRGRVPVGLPLCNPKTWFWERKRQHLKVTLRLAERATTPMHSWGISPLAEKRAGAILRLRKALSDTKKAKEMPVQTLWGGDNLPLCVLVGILAILGWRACPPAPHDFAGPAGTRSPRRHALPAAPA